MNERFPCYYPIFALPPNIYHFNCAAVLSQKQYIAEVILLIPKQEKGELTQDQCVELFDLYTRAYPMTDVRIVKSENSNLFKELKETFDKNYQINAYVALDEKTARSKEFNDMFVGYNNMQLELVPSNFEEASKKMEKAIKNNERHEFFKYVPEDLTPDDRRLAWKIVHPGIEEQVVTKKFWKDIFNQMID